MVDELTVECLNRGAGCEFTCQRQLLAAHIKADCLFTEEPCPDSECSRKALRKDILGDNPPCPHRIVVCDSCAAEMRAFELEVSILALIHGMPLFLSPCSRIAGCVPWRLHDALLAISSIHVQKLQLIPRNALPQSWLATKPLMAVAGRENASH